METANKSLFFVLALLVIWLYIWHHQQQKKKFKKILISNIKKFRKEYGDPVRYLNSKDGSIYSSIYSEINNASTYELKTLDILLADAYSRAKVELVIGYREQITPNSYEIMQNLDAKLAHFKNQFGNPMNYLDPDDREIWQEFSFENKAMIGKYWDILNRAYTRAHQISQVNKKQVG